LFKKRPFFFGLILDTQVGQGQTGHGTQYRTAMTFSYKHMITRHLMVAQALRVNIASNLNPEWTTGILPVRGDVGRFAKRRFSLDRSYLSWMHSFGDWHMAVTSGYLEEMYGGIGGEILYRPFGRTFALGAELWEALKRDPGASLNLGYNGDHLLTGHVKAWYEIPDTALTVETRIGRYLAEDVGGTLALSGQFKNGARITAFVTGTAGGNTYTSSEGGTHVYGGLRLHLPLGRLPYLPVATEADLKISPFGLDTGQAIDNPVPLYRMTDNLSYRGITRHWTDLR
jgi:hypothetical protein